MKFRLRRAVSRHDTCAPLGQTRPATASEQKKGGGQPAEKEFPRIFKAQKETRTQHTLSGYKKATSSERQGLIRRVHHGRPTSEAACLPRVCVERLERVRAQQQATVGGAAVGAAAGATEAPATGRFAKGEQAGSVRQSRARDACAAC